MALGGMSAATTGQLGGPVVRSAQIGRERPSPVNALHYKTAYWVEKGVFDRLSSFSDFESRVNDIVEEKDRGDVFEIFIEGYLETQAITQHVKHWVVGGGG